MKEFPVGSCIFMKIKVIVLEDIPIIDIFYKYNSWKVLGFIATEGGGGNDSVNPYSYHLPDIILTFLFALFFVLIHLAGI